MSQSGTSFHEDSTVSTLSFNNTQKIVTKKNSIDVANPRKVPEHLQPNGECTDESFQSYVVGYVSYGN